MMLQGRGHTYIWLQRSLRRASIGRGADRAPYDLGLVRDARRASHLTVPPPRRRKHRPLYTYLTLSASIPPLTGWTAYGGSLLPSSSDSFQLVLPSFLTSVPVAVLAVAENPLAPLALCILLYSWQFPHFNGLSHLVRESYAQAQRFETGIPSERFGKIARKELKHKL